VCDFIVSKTLALPLFWEVCHCLLSKYLPKRWLTEIITVEKSRNRTNTRLVVRSLADRARSSAFPLGIAYPVDTSAK
jgi:hypothetical protein